MKAFVFHILKLNIIAAVAIALVLLISGVRKNKYSARWKYYIWLVISILLLVPVQPGGMKLLHVQISSANEEGLLSATDGSANTVVNTVDGSTNTVSDAADGSLNTVSDAADGSLNTAADAEAASAVVNMNTTTGEKASPESERSISNTQSGILSHAGGGNTVYISLRGDLWNHILQIGVWLWLAGAALLAVYRILLYNLALHNLQRWAVPVTDKRIKSLYRKECRKKHIKNPPKLMCSSRLTSPVLAGLLKTRLYYIDSEYTMEELQFVFSHELSHYRSKDLWYKMLLMIVTTVYWFNPLLHFMLKEADKDIENLRDISVVKEFDSRERKQYQFLLLKTAVSHELRIPWLSASLNDSAQVFQDRILYMRNQRFLKRGILPAVLLTVLIVFSNVAVGAATEDVQNPEKISKQDIRQQSDLPGNQQTPAQESGIDNPQEESWADNLAGDQTILYTLDYYSANYVYKANDGNWYDGSGRAYVRKSADIWESMEDGSEWTNVEPESVADHASAEVRIADEEGFNEMTLYQDSETGVWQNIAGGVFTDEGNDMWRAMDGNLWHRID